MFLGSVPNYVLPRQHWAAGTAKDCAKEDCTAKDCRYAGGDCAAEYYARKGCTVKDYAQERLHDGKLCETS